MKNWHRRGENGHNRYQEQNSEGKEDLRSDKKLKRSQEEEEG